MCHRDPGPDPGEAISCFEHNRVTHMAAKGLSRLDGWGDVLNQAILDFNDPCLSSDLNEIQADESRSGRLRL